MHDIAQKPIFFFKLPELDLDPDLVVNFPDPDPAKRSGSDRIQIRIRIRNTDWKYANKGLKALRGSVVEPKLFFLAPTPAPTFNKFRLQSQLQL
jgi:hypothetical protein